MTMAMDPDVPISAAVVVTLPRGEGLLFWLFDGVLLSACSCLLSLNYLAVEEGKGGYMAASSFILAV